MFFTVTATIIFAIPSGYYENYKIFGNHFGPIVIRSEHSFKNEAIRNVINKGSTNLVRYTLDFISMDGLPIVPSGLKKKIADELHQSGVNLETSGAVRAPFSFVKNPRAHEDFSYWGILGFALIWPVTVLQVFNFFKSPNARILSIATVLFLIIQSFSGPYDPWRGRYFIVAAIFAAPILGCLNLEIPGKLLKYYLIVIVSLGCLSALTGVIFRRNSELFTFQIGSYRSKSIFALDRIQQLTLNNSSYYEAIKNYENRVPKTATVAVMLKQDSYEYPLFGEKLTRKLYPMNTFRDGVKEIPDVEYLLFSKYLLLPESKDIFLGQDWYLRQLKK